MLFDALRANVLPELLRSCVSVKTVRLCVNLGRELGGMVNADSTAT
jgi:hypothetical protein